MLHIDPITLYVDTINQEDKDFVPKLTSEFFDIN